MISVSPMSVSPVMESVEEVTACVTSIHIYEEPNNKDISPPVVVTSVGGGSAATKLSNKTSRYSGVECLHIKGRYSDTENL